MVAEFLFEVTLRPTFARKKQKRVGISRIVLDQRERVVVVGGGGK